MTLSTSTKQTSGKNTLNGQGSVGPHQQESSQENAALKEQLKALQEQQAAHAQKQRAKDSEIQYLEKYIDKLQKEKQVQKGKIEHLKEVNTSLQVSHTIDLRHAVQDVRLEVQQKIAERDQKINDLEAEVAGLSETARQDELQKMTQKYKKGVAQLEGTIRHLESNLWAEKYLSRDLEAAGIELMWYKLNFPKHLLRQFFPNGEPDVGQRLWDLL